MKEKADNEYEYLIGKSKDQIIEVFDLCYNDINSDLWYFYLYNMKGCFFCKKYLYLFFTDGKVEKILLKRFKMKY